MESSKEKIEAQLCAYIDGELDSVERAEIERHLAANSQHKALIAELRRQSGLLQDLPKMSAPAELNEALCGQLERSSLLDPIADESDHAILSISRWPQVTAIAAVLVLAIGLGVVVYYVLPPSQTRGPVALGTAHLANELGKAGRSPVDGAPRDQTSHSRTLADAGRAEKYGARPPGLAKAAPSAAVGIDPNLIRGDRSGLITAREVEMLRNRTAADKEYDSNNPSLYLIVAAENPVQAAKQVTAYFRANNILYMSYDEGASGAGLGPAAGAGSGVAEPQTDSTRLAANRGTALNDAIKRGGAALKPQQGIAAEHNAAPLAKDQVKAAEPKPSDADAVAQAAPSPARRDGERFAQPSDQPNSVVSGTSESSLDRAAAAGPARETQNNQKWELQMAGDLASAKNGADLDGIFRARMNRRQADELKALLAQQQGQRAALSFEEIRADSNAPSAPPAAFGYRLHDDEYVRGQANDGIAAAKPKAAPAGAAKQDDAGNLAEATHAEQHAPPAPAAAFRQTAPVPSDRKMAAAKAVSPDAAVTQIKEAAAAEAQRRQSAPASAQPLRQYDRNHPEELAKAPDERKRGALSLQTDPLDEPVDVLIVVKHETPAGPATFQLGIQPATHPSVGAADAGKSKK